MRVVLDSSILVRAFRSPGGIAYNLLFAIISGDHKLILSGEMLHEVAKVLRFPRMMQDHRRNEETIYNFIGLLTEAAEIVQIDPLIHASIRDYSDIVVLQTVILGDAEVICAGDRDFFEPPASIFLASRGIEVLTDAQLMQKLKA